MALIALVMGSSDNVARLLEMDAACQSLFVDCLPACGDFGIQVHACVFTHDVPSLHRWRRLETEQEATHWSASNGSHLLLLPQCSKVPERIYDCRWTWWTSCIAVQGMATPQTPIWQLSAPRHAALHHDSICSRDWTGQSRGRPLYDASHGGLILHCQHVLQAKRGFDTLVHGMNNKKVGRKCKLHMMCWTMHVMSTN